MDSHLIIIGYSGHSFVVLEAAIAAGYQLYGYFDQGEKAVNPYSLKFLGKSETDHEALMLMQRYNWIVGIGDNKVRNKVQTLLTTLSSNSPVNIIHPSAILASNIQMGAGVFVSANVVLQPLARIGNGVICNTGCIIEHECILSDFVHVAPGAVLAGNVAVGCNTFVGANSVIKQGVIIGRDCIIGAGAVVIRDVPDGSVVAGSPARPIPSKL